jgi:hypothetical protein
VVTPPSLVKVPDPKRPRKSEANNAKAGSGPERRQTQWVVYVETIADWEVTRQFESFVIS